MWGRLVAIPFLCTIFAAMVWHARRRQVALRQVEAIADTRASLLERQERFIHDASHELRTPVTIARGHLELLRRDVPNAPEVVVALDELERIEHIVARLLLLANADQPDFVVLRDVEIDASSKMSSCAGRRSRRVRGGSRSTSPASFAPTPRRSGTRSTLSSRTR